MELELELLTDEQDEMKVRDEGTIERNGTCKKGKRIRFFN